MKAENFTRIVNLRTAVAIVIATILAITADLARLGEYESILLLIPVFALLVVLYVVFYFFEDPTAVFEYYKKWKQNVTKTKDEGEKVKPLVISDTRRDE